MVCEGVLGNHHWKAEMWFLKFTHSTEERSSFLVVLKRTSELPLITFEVPHYLLKVTPQRLGHMGPNNHQVVCMKHFELSV